MSKIFPSMHSKPEKGTFFALIPYCILSFIVIPTNLPLLGAGLWDDPTLGPWLEIGYHAVNTLLVIFLSKSYLKEEWFMVSTDFKFYLKHAALTVGLILGTEFLTLSFLAMCGVNISNMLQGLPMVDMTINHTPLSLLYHKPLFGTLTMVLLVPLSVTVLFYCFSFSPLAYKRPWLGYLSILVVTAIPPVVDIIWRGEAALTLSMYFVQLPIHLLACWSYQKTDNVWTPIGALMGTNLVLSVIMMVLLV